MYVILNLTIRNCPQMVKKIPPNIKLTVMDNKQTRLMLNIWFILIFMKTWVPHGPVKRLSHLGKGCRFWQTQPLSSIILNVFLRMAGWSVSSMLGREHMNPAPWTQIQTKSSIYLAQENNMHTLKRATLLNKSLYTLHIKLTAKRLVVIIFTLMIR